jgi:hypothetical protein
MIPYVYVSPTCFFHRLHRHSCRKTFHRSPTTGSLTVLVIDVINSCCLSDCIFSPKLLTHRAELRMQVHSKHSLRKHVYGASFNSVFPFVGQHPATIRKFTVKWISLFLVSHLPEYKKVHDTRRLHKRAQQPGVSQDTAENDLSSDSSDNDSLPNVHWCKAFLCYCSRWPHGKPRMPPRWILERVDEYGEDGATSSGRDVTRGSNQLHVSLHIP